jgi:hypothetical protein
MFLILSPSAIRSLFHSPLRHPLAHSPNLVFAIDSITSPDLPIQNSTYGHFKVIQRRVGLPLELLFDLTQKK